MRVLILGFDNYAELDAAMQKLIEENQYYLFYVMVTGEGLAKEWAENNGAPLYWLKEPTLDKIAYYTDYIVLKLSSQTPQWHKNLMMKIKNAGKHGTVLR